MRTVLITGAAGFIGSHTCDLFLAAGHRVIGVDDFSGGRPENIATFARYNDWVFEERDLIRNDALDQMVRRFRPDAVVHLAGLVSVQRSIEEPELNYQLNLYATHLLAEAVRRNKIPRVVFASSAAVYGNEATLPINESAKTRPISPYGATKLASETLLLGYAETYGFTVRCQRYFNVYGSRQSPLSPYSGVISRFIAGLRNHEGVTIYGTGSQTRDFISVKDVARANLLAATSPRLPSGTANICTGRPIAIKRLLEILVTHFPGCSKQQYVSARENDILHSYGDPSRAATELAFTPEITLEDGIAILATPPENLPSILANIS